MDIEKIKTWLIREINNTEDLDMLLYLKSAIGHFQESDEGYNFEELKLDVVNEPEIAMEGTDKTSANLPLTEEQRECKKQRQGY